MKLKNFYGKKILNENLLNLLNVLNLLNLLNGNLLIKEENKSRMLWRKGLVTKLIKGKDNLIRGAELKVYQPSLSKCTHINRPLQLLVPFEVIQERTPAEKEITNRTDNSIGKLVRPRRVAAQNADILQRLIMEDEWPLSLGGVSCKHNFNLWSILIGLFFIYFWSMFFA